MRRNWCNAPPLRHSCRPPRRNPPPQPCRLTAPPRIDPSHRFPRWWSPPHRQKTMYLNHPGQPTPPDQQQALPTPRSRSQGSVYPTCRTNLAGTRFLRSAPLKYSREILSCRLLDLPSLLRGLRFIHHAFITDHHNGHLNRATALIAGFHPR